MWFRARRLYGDEARPCYLANRQGKSAVPDHSLDVQAFHSNPAVARNQVIGNFVPVFSAKVSHSSVQPVDLSTLLCPVASTLLLARERSLRTPQLRQLAFKKTRVGNLFSVRSRCELSEPNVQTDSREHVCDLDRLRNFASHHHEPSIGFTLKAKSLDRSLNLTVQAYADRPDVLYAEFVPFESNPVSVAREENRIESISRLETRVSRFLTGFDASKEIGESFIESPKCCLGTAKVDRCKPSVVFALVFEPTLPYP